MVRLDRRTFLGTALLAPLTRMRVFAQRARPPAGDAATIAVDDFLRLSQRLTGRPKLDAPTAATYLAALLSVPGNNALLARLAAANTPAPDLTPAHVALERTIVEWWYTGTFTIKGETRLATHAGALMWTAIGVPAPGTCASAFGAWSRPRTTADR